MRSDAVRDAFGEARRLQELIVTEPDIRGGMPTLKGSRRGALEIGDQARLESPEELYAEHPTLKPELLAAAIEYAKQFEDDMFRSAFRRVRGTVPGDINLVIGDGDED
ncbi:DUF433 domain-containing protein [Roseovarius sp. D22-M7]|uniref:DUF433 domain-containing protein n=1 Tax=Roseovarius sp. D22-M7 TaxID=3127116 RepID=UPI0030100BAF